VWGGPTENLAAELAERLGMHWCWASLPAGAHHHAEHGGDMMIGNAVLSRWPIAAQAELALPAAAREQPRVAVHARINAPGGELPFFTTHLTHQPDGSAQRVAQVRALAGFVAAHRDGAAYPPVVTGDLNAEPDSDEVRLLCGHKTAPAREGFVLVDAWRYAPSDALGWTWDRANPHVLATMEPSSRIDYVLVGPPRSGRRGAVLSARRIGAEPVEGVWPSDHAGVLAELESG
jgi:endonuclease/exonuclease/phosphatase family metal-dependent hydrolase